MNARKHANVTIVVVDASADVEWSPLVERTPLISRFRSNLLLISGNRKTSVNCDYCMLTQRRFAQSWQKRSAI
jgi:hypothetical protein